MASLLKGVGFITGAAAGIGKATASAFAIQGARALALADINPVTLHSTTTTLKSAFPHVDFLPLTLDTSSEESVANAVQNTVKCFGRVDYAVNNAGIAGKAGRTAESGVEGWRRTVDVNLSGVWLCGREEMGVMLGQDVLEEGNPRSNRGVIINVASMYGVIGTNADVANVSYTATKHGVVGMTKADAIAYARQGVRVNAICPGYVATPLLQNNMAGMANEIERTPVGRLATVEEIADAIVFLASPLSSYMYGAAMVVDGGYTVQ